MQAYRGSETTQSGLVLVVAVHALVIYAMWTGLTRTVIDRIRPPMDVVTVVDTKPPEPERQPLPPVKVSSAPQVTVPLQDIVIEAPAEAPRITLPAATDPGPPALDAGNHRDDGAATRVAPVRKEFKPAYRVEPGYPRQAQREGIGGTVVVRIHVPANSSVGRVEVISSANHLLEREVVRALSQWRYAPEPVGFIAEYEIAFKLRD